MTYISAALWGKTLDDGTYPLRRHLLDTSAAAFALWDLWLRPGLRTTLADALAGGDEHLARRIVAAVAGLHDVGKASAVFQAQSLSRRGLPKEAAASVAASREAGLGFQVPDEVATAPDEIRRHEVLTQAILGRVPQSLDELVGRDWAGAAAGGHHGRYQPSSNDTCPAVHTAIERLRDIPGWRDAQTELVEEVLAACGVTADDLRRPIEGLPGVAVILLTGVVVVADWLASDDLTAPEVKDPTKYLERQRARIARRLPHTLGTHRSPKNPRTAVMGNPRIPLHPLQADAEHIDRGLWIVAETTGSGKTEAAMLRHFTADGESVVWGLPTRATADKMWARIRRMYRGTRNLAALLHAHRSLDGFYLSQGRGSTDVTYSSWAHGVLANLKPLLSPVAVGTVDQVLLAAMRQKWNPVRLLAVANAHIILDEVHTFDEYQVQLVEELLTWWGLTDTRVTMLSASLPTVLVTRFAEAYADQQMTLAPAYPGHTLVTPAGDAAVTSLTTARAYDLDIDVKHLGYRSEQEPIFTLALEAEKVVRAMHEKHPDARIAVILNRVDTCVMLGDLLLRDGILDVTVMHSRMAAGHRGRISEELETLAGKHSTTPGSIVVGTQVIEASLDLDFDLMVTELAPAASLIQRAGRLWRSSTPPSADGAGRSSTPPSADGAGWTGHWHPRPTERPKLTVLSMMSPDGAVSDALALPYTLGALTRTHESLPKTLRIPEDVQHLVDEAHFDLRDGHTFDSAERTRELVRALAVKDVVIGAQSSGLFGPDLSYGDLARLTLPDPVAESATRYSDFDQVSVLVVDETSRSHWAFRGDHDAEKALATRRPREVSLLLAKTIRVAADKVGPGKALEPIYTADELAERTIFAASELRDVIPVRLNRALASYDEVLGLRLGR